MAERLTKKFWLTILSDEKESVSLNDALKTLPSYKMLDMKLINRVFENDFANGTLSGLILRHYWVYLITAKKLTLPQKTVENPVSDDKREAERRDGEGNEQYNKLLENVKIARQEYIDADIERKIQDLQRLLKSHYEAVNNKLVMDYLAICELVESESIIQTRKSQSVEQHDKQKSGMSCEMQKGKQNGNIRPVPQSSKPNSDSNRKTYQSEPAIVVTKPQPVVAPKDFLESGDEVYLKENQTYQYWLHEENRLMGNGYIRTIALKKEKSKNLYAKVTIELYSKNKKIPERIVTLQAEEVLYCNVADNKIVKVHPSTVECAGRVLSRNANGLILKNKDKKEVKLAIKDCASFALGKPSEGYLLILKDGTINYNGYYPANSNSRIRDSLDSLPFPRKAVEVAIRDGKAHVLMDNGVEIVDSETVPGERVRLS